MIRLDARIGFVLPLAFLGAHAQGVGSRVFEVYRGAHGLSMFAANALGLS